MNDVTFVYFEGCPEARNVRAALLTAGVYEFKVVLQNHLPKDDPFRRLSSPSVLKGQELIYGIRTEGEVSSCTFDYVNFADESKLVERFKELKATNLGQSVMLRSFLTPGFAALLVLKCPACIPGVAALLSALGLGFVLSQAVLKSVLVLLLLITMFGFLYSYLKSHKNYYPVILGFVFSATLYISRFHDLEGFNATVAYLSAAGLICASLWDLKLRSRKRCPACI